MSREGPALWDCHVRSIQIERHSKRARQQQPVFMRWRTPTVLRTQTELLPLFFMAEMVAEARLACITLGVVLDPKLLSLRILHL